MSRHRGPCRLSNTSQPDKGQGSHSREVLPPPSSPKLLQSFLGFSYKVENCEELTNLKRHHNKAKDCKPVIIVKRARPLARKSFLHPVQLDSQSEGNRCQLLLQFFSFLCPIDLDSQLLCEINLFRLRKASSVICKFHLL